MTMTTAALLARAQDGGCGRRRPRGEAEAAAVHRRVQARHPRGVRAADRPGREGRAAAPRGLVFGHIVEWRRARDAGAVAELPPKHRQKRADARAGRARNVRRRKIARLEDELGQAQAWRWRSREKHRSSWRGCWPRARTTETRGSSRDRRVLQRDRAAARHEDRVRGGRAGPGPPTTAGEARPRPRRAKPRPAPPNKLTDDEVDADAGRAALAAVRRLSPAQVYFILLDEGIYLASVSTLLPDPARPTARSANGAARRRTRPR